MGLCLSIPLIGSYLAFSIIKNKKKTNSNSLIEDQTSNLNVSKDISKNEYSTDNIISANANNTNILNIEKLDKDDKI